MTNNKVTVEMHNRAAAMELAIVQHEGAWWFVDRDEYLRAYAS